MLSTSISWLKMCRKCKHKRLFSKTWTAGFEVLTAVAMKSSTFWDIMPYTPPKIDEHFIWTFHLHLIVEELAKWETSMTLAVSWAYFLILKMEAIHYSETSVNFHLTTRYYIPEDGIVKYMNRFRSIIIPTILYKAGQHTDEKRFQSLVYCNIFHKTLVPPTPKKLFINIYSSKWMHRLYTFI
jgi:hypothetical protein